MAKFEKEKKSRAWMKMPHTSGTISFARRAEMVERIENLRATKETNGETSQILESLAPLEGDILSQAIGPKRHRHVYGMGFGVTPKMFGKANIDTIKEHEQEKEEKRILIENYKTLSNEMTQLKDLVAKLIGSNVEHIGQTDQDIEQCTSFYLGSCKILFDVVNLDYDVRLVSYFDL
ncbi:putative Transposase, Ptta/En/Spm, plant [Cocos nucifera]|uniref:Putative Transposase, Ptta/En/Spm, plant n=1 Tax=Cocos nucifera TaxID=13894 RepID=A0A8K0ID33_COCNU|nr:putative Transposase, Ptta/En/Spm, plant [Cocos nucifera]